MGIACITGASGLLGSNLAIALVEAGHEVRCTRRRSSKVAHLADRPISWVEADINDAASLPAAFAGVDVVFHCAAQVTIQRKATPEIVRTNVDGTRHVLEAVRSAGVGRLVHCSSVAAVGIAEGPAPSTEEAAWNLPAHGLDDGYAATKHDAELLVRAAADVDAVVVNPAYMFGPYDSRPSSGKLLLDLARGKVPAVPPGVNNFVDARAVARGMIAAWQKGKRGERYILGDRNMSYRAFFELAAGQAGVAPPRLPLPLPLAALVGWAGDLQELITGREALINTATTRWSFCETYTFSSEKARRELGYEPGSLEDAVKDTLAWFKQAGMLQT